MSSLATVVRAEEFNAPGPSNFDLPGFFDSSVTKPMVQLVLAAIIVFAFFWLAVRRGTLVPSRLQYAGESAYNMVRNGVARDVIGGHDFRAFVPYLVALFFFILVNNVFATIPFIQFPTFSRASMAYALAALSWVIYNAVGIRRHGLLGYLKLQTVPSGVTVFMLPLLVPLEFFSNILVRPVTLALRLFANMFAGTSCSSCSRPVASTSSSTAGSGTSQARWPGCWRSPSRSWSSWSSSCRPTSSSCSTRCTSRARSPKSTEPLPAPTELSTPTAVNQPEGNTAVNGNLNMIGYGLAAIGPGVGIGLIFAATSPALPASPRRRAAPGDRDPRLRAGRDRSVS